jgi:hypothetical protein
MSNKNRESVILVILSVKRIGALLLFLCNFAPSKIKEKKLWQKLH